MGDSVVGLCDNVAENELLQFFLLMVSHLCVIVQIVGRLSFT